MSEPSHVKPPHGKPLHSKPQWLEICIHIDPFAHEALNSFLFDLGCQGVLIEAATVKTYLPLPPNAGPITGEIYDRICNFFRHLEKIFPDISRPGLEIRPMETQDWDLQWRRFFRAQQVTERLLILPAWESIPRNHEGHVIQMDPGPAFGTGQHPTTRMCLRAMEGISPPRPWTMLDVGTGSGILAIYGAKLGARRILAIDRDPEAVRWARRNIALNGVQGPIEISGRPLERCTDTFTLIVANLTLNGILEVFSRLSPLLAAGGWLVLSGLLRNQRKDLEGPLGSSGLIVHKTLVEQEWMSLIAGRVHP